MSEVRYEKEQEAITARLVSLYRAIDRINETCSRVRFRSYEGCLQSLRR